MKIQIASLEALERLIGNDNELEIELRSSIVQDFTKKHLKALALDPVIQKTGEAIKQEFLNRLTETYKPQGSYYNQIKLSSEGLKLVDLHVEQKLNELISTAVSNKIASYDLDKRLKEKLDYAVAIQIDKLSDINLNLRLNRMVDEKLRQALAMK